MSSQRTETNSRGGECNRKGLEGSRAQRVGSRIADKSRSPVELQPRVVIGPSSLSSPSKSKRLESCASSSVILGSESELRCANLLDCIAVIACFYCPNSEAVLLELYCLVFASSIVASLAAPLLVKGLKDACYLYSNASLCVQWLVEVTRVVAVVESTTYYPGSFQKKPKSEALL